MANEETTAEKERVRRYKEEDRHTAIRRLVHEFASYAVWHMSLTKPSDLLAIRILISSVLTEWSDNEFVCGNPTCIYCNDEMTVGRFRQSYRNLMGRREGIKPRKG